MERGPHRLGVTIVLCAAMLVAACGGSSKSSSTSAGSSPSPGSSTSSSSSSSPSRTAEELAADQQTAQTIVLKLDDFPSGWKAKSRGPSSSDTPEAKAAAKKLADCLGIDPALVDDTSDPNKAKARSDKFTSGELQVESTATVQASVEHKNEILDAFRKPEAIGCFEDFINTAFTSALAGSDSSQLPAGTEVGGISVTAGDLTGIHGEAIDFRATIPFSFEGQSITLVSDFVFVLKGRTSLDFSFDNSNEPFPADLAVQLANESIDRVPDS